MADILVLQHVDCEHLGRIAEVLDARNLTYRYVRPDKGESSGLEDAWGLIVMGGPMGVYEQDRYPFLRDEIQTVVAAVKRQIPVLGICLGAQLVAAALGADVRPSGSPEIGWHTVCLTPEGAEDGLLGSLPADFSAFHWHYDVFDLPDGAVSLADSVLTPCQGFRFGDRVYGLQFHPEITEAIVDDWTETFGEGLRASGIEPETIHGATALNLREYSKLTGMLFERWADLVK